MLDRFDSYLFFMKYMPYYSLFLLTLFSGTIITLSSNHWIYIWIGFEVNLISFIPLILHSSNNQETEAAVKYFLVQALGSSLILLSSLSILFSPFSIFSYNISIFNLIFALLIKIGAAPFHFWLPQVMSRITWTSCIILATWQKIAPLLIMISISCFFSNKIIIILATLRTIIGGLGGLNQTHLRPLLAYSSIRHLGWMIARAVISSISTIIYFLIYSLITLSIILSVSINSSKTNYISSISNISLSFSICLIILFISLGGLPPLLGFLPKWLIIKTLILENIVFFSFIIIISSLIRLFYYLSVFFNIFINHTPSSGNTPIPKNIIVNLTIISTITLGLVPIMA